MIILKYLYFFSLETLSCDHTKVTPYFIESINSKTGFWAVPCPNRIQYNLGLCVPNSNKEYVLMGEHVRHTYVTHFLLFQTNIMNHNKYNVDFLFTYIHFITNKFLRIPFK